MYPFLITQTPPIALEITLPDPLFRRLQATLDADPTLSLDDLMQTALSLYLEWLTLQSTATHPPVIARN